VAVWPTIRLFFIASPTYLRRVVVGLKSGADAMQRQRWSPHPHFISHCLLQRFIAEPGLCLFPDVATVTGQTGPCACDNTSFAFLSTVSITWISLLVHRVLTGYYHRSCFFYRLDKICSGSFDYINSCRTQQCDGVFSYHEKKKRTNGSKVVSLCVSFCEIGPPPRCACRACHLAVRFIHSSAVSKAQRTRL